MCARMFVCSLVPSVRVPLSECVFSMRMSAAVFVSCNIVIGHSTTDIAGMAAQALRLKWKALHFIFTGSEHSSASHHEKRHAIVNVNSGRSKDKWICVVLVWTLPSIALKYYRRASVGLPRLVSSLVGWRRHCAFAMELRFH